MSLAVAGLYRARWTAKIHEEWIDALLKREPQRDRAKLEATRDLMDRVVLDCLISGYEPLISSLTLPDVDDRHALAAAISGRAEVIVTCNLKHFPESALRGYSIQAQHPDDFIFELIELEPEAAYLAVKQQRERLKNPPKNVEEFLTTLSNQQLPKTVERLREGIDEI